jgi:hypothetical protein
MGTNRSSALYTTVEAVASACLDSDNAAQRLTVAAAATHTSITVNIVPPNWTINTKLLIDAAGQPETVTVTAIAGLAISVTALAYAHAAGCSVFNATILSGYIGPASRYFDEETRYNAGWASEAWTDVKEAKIDNCGNVSVALGKPYAEIADVTSVSIRNMHSNQISALDLTNAFINGFFLVVPAKYLLGERKCIATVEYTGGFDPLPDFVPWATSVIAARMYRERQTGYSDTTGSAETGMISFKKALPPDVYDIIIRNRRWIP